MTRAKVSCLFAFGLVGASLTLPAEGQEPAEGREPSEFRSFTDKQNQRIEAQIIAISEDRRLIKIRRRDGHRFELEATKLSLDDQQFLRNWLEGESAVSRGTIRVFGNLPKEMSIDVNAAEGRDDIVAVHALKAGWIALTAAGDVLSFSEQFRGLDGMASISANTLVASFTRKDGTVWNSPGQQEAPEKITTAIQTSRYGGQRLALLPDGSVKAWGGRFGPEPIDPPITMSRALGVATKQGGVAVLEKGGVVHGWVPGETEVHTAALGKNAIAIQGSIFHFLVLTEEGEVFEWAGKSPESAKIPQATRNEGPFVAIRCNGSTRAAQREDGSWIAWGMNGAGIVDFINGLGPVPDLAFFSEPGQRDHGYVVWIEPKPGS